MVKQALVIGGGPAGLMAAEQLLGAGLRVTIAEAKPSFGRKFLMAGKSGLNLTKDEPSDEFGAQFYGTFVIAPITLCRGNDFFVKLLVRCKALDDFFRV